MTKVTLTKEQAAGMKSIKEKLSQDDYGVFASQASVILYKVEDSFVGVRRAVNSLSDADFITALLEGYEVEKDSNDLIKEMYENAANLDLPDRSPHCSDKSIYNDGFKDGMAYVLKTKEIIIEGIDLD